VKEKFESQFIPRASSTFVSAGNDDDDDDAGLDASLHQLQLNVSIV